MVTIRRLADAFSMKDVADTALMTITVRTGQQPTEEQLKEVRNAARLAPVADDECPPSSSAALAEFAAKARVLRKGRNVRPAVTIRIDPACLETYKALGRGYTGIMAEVLAYAAAHPDMLENFSGTSRT